MPTHDEALRALDRVRCSGMPSADSMEAVATIRAYIWQAKADAVDAAKLRELQATCLHTNVTTYWNESGRTSRCNVCGTEPLRGDVVPAHIRALIAARSAKTGEKT